MDDAPGPMVVNFSPWRCILFAQAPASDAKVDQSTGLFDGSSDMFRVSMIALVSVLGVAICIGLAYHYVIFLPRRTKGKESRAFQKKKKTSMETTLHLLVRKEIWEFRESEEIFLQNVEREAKIEKIQLFFGLHLEKNWKFSKTIA